MQRSLPRCVLRAANFCAALLSYYSVFFVLFLDVCPRDCVISNSCKSPMCTAHAPLPLGRVFVMYFYFSALTRFLGANCLYGLDYLGECESGCVCMFVLLASRMVVLCARACGRSIVPSLVLLFLVLLCSLPAHSPLAAMFSVPMRTRTLSYTHTHTSTLVCMRLHVVFTTDNTLMLLISHSLPLCRLFVAGYVWPDNY